MPIPFGLSQVHQAQGMSWGDPGSNEQDAIYFQNNSFVIDARSGSAIGHGDILENSAPLALDVAHGTANQPLTGVAGNPTIRIARTENYTSTSSPADGSKNAAIQITTVGQSGSVQQVIGVNAIARTLSTNGGDACALAGVSWVFSGNRVAGNYMEGRRSVNTGQCYGIEVRSQNNTLTNGGHNTTIASDCSGLWISSSGTAHSSEAIGIGGLASSTRWDYGIHFKGGGQGCITACIVDQSAANYSYEDLGTHSFASFNIASTVPLGIDLSGGTFSSGPIKIPNNNQVLAENAAGNGSVGLFYLDTSNHFVLPTYTIVTAAFQHTGSSIGFFNSGTVSQQNGTGNTHTVAAGSTTNVFINTTFDGSTGSTAYTVGDIVKALKNYGLLAG